MYAILNDDDELVGGKPLAVVSGAFSLNGVNFPANWLRLSSELERQALHIWPLVTAELPPLHAEVGEGVYSFDGVSVTRQPAVAIDNNLVEAERAALVSVARATALTKIAAITDPVKGRPVSTESDPAEIYKDAMEAQLRAARYQSRGNPNGDKSAEIRAAFDQVDAIDDAKEAIISDIIAAPVDQLPSKQDIVTDPRWG